MKKIVLAIFIFIFSITIFSKNINKEMLFGKKFINEKYAELTIEFGKNDTISGNNGITNYSTQFDIYDNQLILMDNINEDKNISSDNSDKLKKREKLYRSLKSNQKIELNNKILKLTDVLGTVETFKEVK